MQNDIKQTLALQVSVGCSTCEMREQMDDHRPVVFTTSKGQLWSIATSIASFYKFSYMFQTSWSSQDCNDEFSWIWNEWIHQSTRLLSHRWTGLCWWWHGHNDICDKAVAWDDWMKHKIPSKHLHIGTLKNREKHIISWSCQHCHLCVFTFFWTFFVLVLLRIDDIAWSPFGDKRHQLKA